MDTILRHLADTLESREGASPDSFFLEGLHRTGLSRILEKVGEEATETILTAKDAENSDSQEEVIKETADLWFQSLVMVSHLGLGPDQVLEGLQKHFNISRLAGKAAKSA